MSLLTAFTVGLLFAGLLLFYTRNCWKNFWRVKPSSGLFLLYQPSSWEFTPGFWGRETWSYLALLRTIIGVCCYSDSVIRLSLLEEVLVQSDKERILEWIRIQETSPCPRSASPHTWGEPCMIFFLRVQFTLCIKTRRGQEQEGQSSLSRLLLSWAERRKKPHSVYAAWMNDFVLKKTNQTNQPCTVSREKDRSVSFLSSPPTTQFQATQFADFSRQSLVLNVTPVMIEKLANGLLQPPEAGHPICMLDLAVNYPYFSWLLLVLFLLYCSKVLLLLKTVLNLRWTSPKETVKGVERVYLQEIEWILCFLVHYRNGSHIMHGRIQHTT